MSSNGAARFESIDVTSREGGTKMCKTRARSDRYRFQFTLVVLMLFSAFSPPVYAQKVSKIYWTDDGTNKIQRANLDGSGIEDLVTTGLDQPEMIALDAGRAKMYWTDAGVDKIRRANFDGSNVEDCNVVGIQFVPNNPRGLALDLKNNKKYWTETHSPQNISRANLDGTKGEDLIKDPAVLPQPRGLAIDVQGNRMYWTDDSQHFIRCADLDGSNISDVITSGLNQPVGIALHLTANKLYFADEGSGTVKRADLDGLNVEDCVTGRAFLSCQRSRRPRTELCGVAALTDLTYVSGRHVVVGHGAIRTLTSAWAVTGTATC